MAAPALDSISRDLSITSPARTNLILSVFMLSYAFGPFFFSPCSEIFGRKWVLQCGNVFFFLCNLACGFAKSEQELVFLRLMAGFGGSANVGVSLYLKTYR
jgi:MFS family permease